MTAEAPARPRLGRTEPAAPIRIVHIGVGAFSRAHQAWYTSAVDTAHEWGIAGFTGRTPTVAQELGPQGGLFTLVERGPESDTATVVDSLVEVDDGADVPRLIELIAAPATAIVSLTVTESGYRLDAGGAPRTDDPDLAHDIAAGRAFVAGDPDAATTARTALGRLVLGLVARRRAAAGPIAVVPCDNIPDNGAWVARGVRAIADRVDPGLGAWIDDHVSFVSTSVDRITPRTLDADRATVAELTGFVDAGPVVTEPFHDWVLSGAFPNGRPSWEAAGARFVDDIEPFERRKLWLLNGAHSLLASLGRLRGHGTVAEAMGDPECSAAVEDFWDACAAHLDVELLDLDGYRRALRDRFGNARIEHRLEQIGMESVAKLRVRSVPVLLAERASGRSGRAAAVTIAAWKALLERADLPALVDAESAAVAAALGRPEAERTRALLAVIDPAAATPDVVALVDGIVL